MDYYKIGQKIRKFRKARGFSQERLAEQAGISITHMSHIETGNTKLSLPVFAALAQALEVPADDLLCEEASSRKASLDEIAEVLESCTTPQLRVITDLARAAQVALNKHMEQENSR